MTEQKLSNNEFFNIKMSNNQSKEHIVFINEFIEKIIPYIKKLDFEKGDKFILITEQEEDVRITHLGNTQTNYLGLLERAKLAKLWDDKLKGEYEND